MTAAGSEAPSAPAGSGTVKERVVVLVCGQRARGDDAAALLAAERLPAALGPVGQVEVRFAGQLEPDDLLALGPRDRVLVLDAVRGVAPGVIVRRSLAELATPGPAPRSSHVLPLRDVLALVAELRGGLPEGTFVGLGGASFEIGAGLSPAVRAALSRYTAAIAAEVARLAGRSQTTRRR